MSTNSTLTTLELSGNEVENEGAGRLAEALATNYTLTEFHFDCDTKTSRLAVAYLNRNKFNLEKKSAMLFVMLLPLLSLDVEDQ